jgi:hypothetical protein
MTWWAGVALMVILTAVQQGWVGDVLLVGGGLALQWLAARESKKAARRRATDHEAANAAINEVTKRSA